MVNDLLREYDVVMNKREINWKWAQQVLINDHIYLCDCNM